MGFARRRCGTLAQSPVIKSRSMAGRRCANALLERVPIVGVGTEFFVALGPPAVEPMPAFVLMPADGARLLQGAARLRSVTHRVDAKARGHAAEQAAGERIIADHRLELATVDLQIGENAVEHATTVAFQQFLAQGMARRQVT